MTRRVVITGMGGVTAFGKNWQGVSARLLAYKDTVRKMPEWQVYDGLHTLLSTPVDDSTLPEHYTRKHIRTMDRVSQISTHASKLALEQTELIGDLILANGETGIAYGSSTGSTGLVSELATMLTERHTNDITGTTYVQMMSHTIAVNAGLSFRLHGRMAPTSSACISGNQAIGYAWEAIRHGYQTVTAAGGAEELCLSEAAVFDTLFATSQHNNAPRTTPSPFDKNRDGLMTGEGAGTLTLEELEHAKARGAIIYDEVVGFTTNYDATHIIQLQREVMQYCMGQSLKIAGLGARDIGYISAHGTTTDHDDIAESLATATIYGDSVPVSSLKGYFGHTFSVCGTFKVWMSLQIMREGWFAPTLNLNKPDPNCGTLGYIVHEARKVGCEFLQSNNFAFGSTNTSIIIKYWP